MAQSSKHFISPIQYVAGTFRRESSNEGSCRSCDLRFQFTIYVHRASLPSVRNVTRDSEESCPYLDHSNEGCSSWERDDRLTLQA